MIGDFLIVHAFFDLFDLLGWFSFNVSIHTDIFIQREYIYIYIHSIYIYNIMKYISIYAVWLYRCIYRDRDNVVDRQKPSPSGVYGIGYAQKEMGCNMIPKRLAHGVVYFCLSVTFRVLRIHINIYIYIHSYIHIYIYTHICTRYLTMRYQYHKYDHHVPVARHIYPIPPYWTHPFDRPWSS